MKCNRCGREISDTESYTYQGQIFCEDCLMEMGLHAGKCEPWASYLATHTRDGLGMTGMEGFTELQKKVYHFIKDNGKANRQEIKQNLGISEAEIDAQLTPLMHAEMVKERSEGNTVYLVTVS